MSCAQVLWLPLRLPGPWIESEQLEESLQNRNVIWATPTPDRHFVITHTHTPAHHYTVQVNVERITYTEDSNFRHCKKASVSVCFLHGCTTKWKKWQIGCDSEDWHKVRKTSGIGAKRTARGKWRCSHNRMMKRCNHHLLLTKTNEYICHFQFEYKFSGEISSRCTSLASIQYCPAKELLSYLPYNCTTSKSTKCFPVICITLSLSCVCVCMVYRRSVSVCSPRFFHMANRFYYFLCSFPHFSHLFARSTLCSNFNRNFY